MSLRAKAEAVETFERGPRCDVEKTLASLTGDDRDWLAEQLADTRRQHTWIARVLRQEGIVLSEGVIGRHRRGDCRCGS